MRAITCSLGLALIFTTACGSSQSAAPTSPPNETDEAASAASPPAEVDESATDVAYTVTFLERSVDLEPYFDGFRYRTFRPLYDADRLFYYEEAEGRRILRVLALEGTLDLEAGEALSEIDWSTRNLWGGEYHEPSDSLLVLADERNDEVMNVYRLDLASGSLEQLTNAPYVYGFHVDPDAERLGYVPRFGAEEPFNTCFHVLDLASGEDRQVACDSPEVRLTWTAVAWHPHGRQVVLEFNQDGDRRRGNLAVLDLDAEILELQPLLPDAVRYRSSLLEDWIDDQTFGYTSAESGFANFYVYDMVTRTPRQVTHMTEETGAWDVIDIGGEAALLVVIDRPHESELQVIDLATGATLGSRVFDGEVSLRDTTDGRAALVLTSLRTPFELLETRFERSEAGVSIAVELRADVPEALATRINQCEIERVQIPTFDVDPSTGEQRTLHGFLLTPGEPLPRNQRLARVTSFYGGQNYFSAESQMLCEAGIATLSPSPRGSWGFGAEFAALNDGDLGGDEIVDIIYAGQWLTGYLGIEPWQVGVYGGSHGGYASMRLLTFPPETNGREAHFDWGFGMSHAGFSNILTFYEACNIPDWVTLEAGDPVTESAKLLDRSPVSHLALLQSPILLTHGENDSRVPVQESRQFVAAAEAEGKAELVTYVEFAGQGHGVSGLENRLRYYRTVFSFLEGVIVRGHNGG